MAEAIWTQKINVRFVSSNPIMRLLTMIWAIFEFLLGIRKKGEFREYTDRIEITTSNYKLWFFKGSETTMIVKRERIAGCSVGFSRQWLFFKVIVGQVFAAGIPESSELVFKGIKYDELSSKLTSVCGLET